MIEPPSTLPVHLQEQWTQAIESAYMEGVIATLTRLRKQLGCSCDLSVNVDAEFLADGRKQFEPDNVVELDVFR